MYFNVQSSFSLLRSTLKVKDYVEFAKKEGIQYLGLADHQHLMGVIDFYDQCQKAGIKPLIGMKVQVKGLIMADQDFDLIFYAKNYQGYQTLIILSQLISREDYSSQMIWETLSSSAHHLVLLSGGQTSELDYLLLSNQVTQANQLVDAYEKYFDIEDIYMGIQAFPFSKREASILINFSQSRNIEMISGQSVTMRDAHQAFSLKVLEAISSNQVIGMDLLHMESYQALYPINELQSIYDMLGLENIQDSSRALSDKLNLVLPMHQPYLPKFKVPSGWDAGGYLRHLAEKNLVAKGLDKELQYRKRMEDELDVIEKMGFADYFLIVWEMMDFCHQNKIRTGPGRGSAAGSLVSYLLSITLVDPIKYDLLFERFLNPERASMPDIDFDLPDTKRDLVLNHLIDLYGYQHVAQISTYGTFGAKQAIRDTLRVLGFNQQVLKKWSESIPSELNMTLKRAYKESGKLRELVHQTEENEQLYRIALSIEGLPRHISTHAAGVIMHDHPLNEVIPVFERSEGMLLSQFTMYDIEKVGLLKLDLLGLRNLTLLDDILNLLKQTRGLDLDPYDFPLDDPSTLQLFRLAKTNGVFQFESRGIKQVLRRLSPNQFEEIVAVNALFRPGPMRQIDEFIKRKKGQVQVTYLHPLLEPILSTTYGIIVYQEQVMQICQQLAGYSLGQADLLRRAMAKKQADVMEKEKGHFIQGCMEKGIEEAIAKQIYDYIFAFADYGFNRSHAVVYSTLAYQLAYLKAHFPLEFYCVLLNQGSSGTQNRQAYIEEVKQNLGNLAGVDINQSLQGFSIDQNKIRIGFELIKGFRKDLIHYILQDRSQYGRYESMQAFVQRLPQKWATKEILEKLIYVGAFDYLGYNRATLNASLPNILNGLEFTLLGQEMNAIMIEKEDWSRQQKASLEQDVLGFSSQPHPLFAYQTWMNQLESLNDVDQASSRKMMKSMALLQDIRVIETKKGDQMAFLKWDTGQKIVSGVLFPAQYSRFQGSLKLQEVYYLEGRVDLGRNNEPQIIMERLMLASTYISQKGEKQKISHQGQRCYIRLQNVSDLDQVLSFLKEETQRYPGPCPIVLVSSNRDYQVLGSEFQIGFGQQVQLDLRKRFGSENVIFQ